MKGNITRRKISPSIKSHYTKIILDSPITGFHQQHRRVGKSDNLFSDVDFLFEIVSYQILEEEIFTVKFTRKRHSRKKSRSLITH